MWYFSKKKWRCDFKPTKKVWVWHTVPCGIQQSHLFYRPKNFINNQYNYSISCKV